MSWDFGSGGTGATGGNKPSGGSEDVGFGSAAPAPVRNPGFEGFDSPRSGGAAPAGASGGSSAPVVWLALGIALGVVAIVVHEVTNGFGSGLVGWLVGGPVVIGVLAVFVHQDTARRADPWYAESSFAPWARRFLVVLSLVAVVLNSLSIADFFSRGGF